MFQWINFQIFKFSNAKFLNVQMFKCSDVWIFKCQISIVKFQCLICCISPLLDLKMIFWTWATGRVLFLETFFVALFGTTRQKSNDFERKTTENYLKPWTFLLRPWVPDHNNSVLLGKITNIPDIFFISKAVFWSSRTILEHSNKTWYIKKGKCNRLNMDQ